MAYKVSHTDAEKCCGGFPLIPSGGGGGGGGGGGPHKDNCGVPDMLKAPYDRFVINDCMYITCTIHM